MLKTIAIYGIAGFILLFSLLLLVISVCSISATASLGQTAQTPQLPDGVTNHFGLRLQICLHQEQKSALHHLEMLYMLLGDLMHMDILQT
jgi:hypothetical protein